MGRILLLCAVCSVAAFAADAGTASSTAGGNPSNYDASSEEEAAWRPIREAIPEWVPDGAVASFVGVRAMRGKVLHDMAPAFQVGATCALGPARWWARPQLGYFQASATRPYTEPDPNGTQFGSNVHINGTYTRGRIVARTTEVDLGMEGSWHWGFLHPSLALGACWVQTRIDNVPSFTLLRQLTGDGDTTLTDGGTTLGGWSALSLDVPIGIALVGITGRYTYARTTVFDQPLDIGGLQVGATLALAW